MRNLFFRVPLWVLYNLYMRPLVPFPSSFRIMCVPILPIVGVRLYLNSRNGVSGYRFDVLHSHDLMYSQVKDPRFPVCPRIVELPLLLPLFPSLSCIMPPHVLPFLVFDQPHNNQSFFKCKSTKSFYHF